MAKGDIWEQRHKKIALPCVRIRTRVAGGSGTVLYSKENDEGEFSTYILTNHHVVADCIKIEKKWSSLLKAYRKEDVFEMVDAHFFEYRWESRDIGGKSLQCDIMAYDEDEDLALIKARASQLAPAVAELYPRKEEKKLRIGMKIITVGAGLGEPPVQTEGVLSQFGREIDRREYWLVTAPSIYGNSGGATFLKETMQMIGVPARIAVTMSGFGGLDAITHLSYDIPITRIYNFLEDQKFRFIYDESFTEQGEEDERKRLRDLEEQKMAVSPEND